MRLTTEEFIRRAREIHGDKYDYSEVVYHSMDSEVYLIDNKTRKEFWQTPRKHLKNVIEEKYSTKNIIEKFKEVHGDKYDYSSFIYKGTHTKFKLLCPDYGWFEVTPKGHIRGQAHPLRYKYNTAKFIEKARLVHGDRYDYSLVEYVNASTKVKIICPDYGEFEQTPNSHLRGIGCSQGRGSKISASKIKPLSYYIEKFKNIHNDKYDYSLVTKVDNYIDIICPNHGIFTQSLYGHSSGSGCPKCVSKYSNPEIELQNFIKDSGYNIELRDRSIIAPYELDIYIPELNKAIEFNGAYWHYHPTHFVPGYHAMKSNLCRAKRIRLLHIREDLWKRDKEKMSNVIKKFLTF